MTSSTANTAPQSGTPYHIPALLRETVESLDIRPGGVYADATFGGGGHSRAILAALGPEGRLFGFDQDSDAMANAPDDPRFTFVLSNFRYMKNWMRYHNIEHLDGIMADLGVSFHHFDTAQRGFSFREEAPLDMRMNCRSHLTAMDVVNGYTDEQLCRILRLYTDLKQAPRIAAAIVKARSQGELATTTQLAAAVESTLNPRSLKKDLAGLSGSPHRGQRRDDSTGGFPEIDTEAAAPRRPTRHPYLSLDRGPHGEELHEDRKYRREIGAGLLRQDLHTLATCQPLTYRSLRGGDRAQSALQKCEIESG